MFVCVLALLLFPDPFVNRFIKPRITKAFAQAYPAYSLRIANMNCNVFKNHFGCDSVALNAVDGTFSAEIDHISVGGISWMHLLRGDSLAARDFANADVDADAIALSFPQSHYELRCGLLRVSVLDSEAVVDSMALYPLGDDEHFFGESRFRQTRFRLVVSRARVSGLACLELLQGKLYCARSAQIHDVSLDVLINKDKHLAKDSSRPPMPNEILSSINGTLQVDSLNILNGRLKYGERFAVGSKPALLMLDSMHVSAEGIANNGVGGAALVIHAHGNFMKAGTMNVLMSIPVASPELSFQYSGTLSGMDLSVLNAFIETAEQKRIKTGVLQAASFDITVASGRASGNVRAVYSDLTIAAINKQTGSDKGFFDGFASAIAKSFKIRGTNVPDKSGSFKIGKVNYTRRPEEFFLEYSWLALRSGVGDVVGF